MIYRISITLKSSGKVIEVLVEQTESSEVFEINQTMSDTEWCIIKGFDAHPLKVSKTVGIRWREIAGVEVTEAEDWLAESAKNFHESLDKTKDENKS